MPQLEIPSVTAGAFSIARYKLKIDLFLDLNLHLNALIDTLPPKLWKGYQLIAGDGTTVNLPVSKSTIDHFGLFRESSHGGKTVLANACMLYDVLSDFGLASCISPFCDGEKTIMARLLHQTTLTNSIILLDRGFSSFSFFKILINNGLDFCVRIKTSGNLFAQHVIEDPRLDFITDWMPSEAEQITCKKKKLDSCLIKVRVTKITLSSGEIEVLVSSLFDMKTFNLKDIKELYRLRWVIEEGFKDLKPKMKLEQFGCKRQEGIYQEFYSHIFMMNLTHLIGIEAQKTIEIKTKGRKYRYKYNWSNAFKFIQNSFVQLFKSNDLEAVIQMITRQIENSVIAIVPNRSFVRQTHSTKKHRASPLYK